MKASLEERFWSRVDKNGPNGCWVWTGGLNPCGYGKIRVGVQTRGAHRVSYEIAKGTVPNGLQLDHLCRNRRCVNPDHMEPVTQRENILRGISFAANNAKQTHCHRGHELAGANLEKSHLRHGMRACILCCRIRDREYRRRRRERA